MMPRPVKTGMSDGVYRIVEHGLMQGDSVVLSANYVEKQVNAQKMGSNPFMPGPPPGAGRGSNPNNNGRTTPKR